MDLRRVNGTNNFSSRVNALPEQLAIESRNRRSTHTVSVPNDELSRNNYARKYQGYNPKIKSWANFKRIFNTKNMVNHGRFSTAKKFPRPPQRPPPPASFGRVHNPTTLVRPPRYPNLSRINTNLFSSRKTRKNRKN